MTLRHSLRLLRPIVASKKIRLLGDDDGAGGFATRTTDTTPELTFRVPAGFTFTGYTFDGANIPVGPVNGPAVFTAPASAAKAAGTYPIVMSGTDDKAQPVTSNGSLTIITAFAWDNDAAIVTDFSTTAYDWSLVNG